MKGVFYGNYFLKWITSGDHTTKYGGHEYNEKKLLYNEKNLFYDQKNLLYDQKDYFIKQ